MPFSSLNTRIRRKEEVEEEEAGGGDEVRMLVWSVVGTSMPEMRDTARETYVPRLFSSVHTSGS